MSKLFDKLYDLPDDEKIDYVYSHYSDREFRKLKAAIIENFNVDFWHETPLCYHATTHENISDIATKGLVVGSKTRVQSNRSIGDVIFTSTDKDNIQFYGDYIFVINTKMMKSDGYMPKVSQEPEFIRKQLIEAILHKLGVEDFEHEVDTCEGIEYSTVVFYDNIPRQYIYLL